MSNLVTTVTPTYLYIKQHTITGKLYFGKTTRTDPIKYRGSGKHWVRHIKHHGKEHVVTLWVELFTDKDSIQEFALSFSKEMNIVESESWLNLVEENGMGGGWVKGKKFSKEHIEKMSLSHKGKVLSKEHKEKISLALNGRILSKETREKIGLAQKGKIISKETREKLSLANKGKPGRIQSNETKEKLSLANIGKAHHIVTCPHCNKSGGISIMTRWHFDRCKFTILFQ